MLPGFTVARKRRSFTHEEVIILTTRYHTRGITLSLSVPNDPVVAVVVVVVVVDVYPLSLSSKRGEDDTKRERDADARDRPVVERNRVLLHRGYGRRWHTD